MKIIKWFLLMKTTIAFGNSVYYADHLIHTELRSTNHSLLLFPAPVISASCQPSLVEFDSLTEENINIYEMNQVQAKSIEEQKQEDNSIVKRLLRIKPTKNNGKSRCSFILNNSEEISVEFTLNEEVTIPLIEFKPLHQRYQASLRSPILKILSGLVENRPIGLGKIEDITTCHTSEHNRSQTCSNFRFSTDTAHYKYLFHGKSADLSGWIIEAELKKDLPFKNAAELKEKAGMIYYSLTTEQKNQYKAGDIIKHHILGIDSLTKEDLKEMLQ